MASFMNQDVGYWDESEVSNSKFNFDDASDGLDQNSRKLFNVQSRNVAKLKQDVKNCLEIDLANDHEFSLEDGGGFNDPFAAPGMQSARYRSNTATSTNSTSSNHGADRRGSVPKAEKRPVTATEMAKMQAEIDHLTRKLQQESKHTFSPLPTKVMILRMIHGESYSLDSYKSKDLKLLLLDTAIEYHDGNAITAVVLFLKNTLKTSTFQKELMKRPDAMNQYLVYLNNRQEFVELSDTLTMLGRMEEAAILNYRISLKSRHLQTRITNMRNCYVNHFQRGPGLTYQAHLVNEHISILERQGPIDAEDARVEKENRSEAFKKFPRSTTLLNSSVITTLYYCCLYHYSLPENNLASPQAIRKCHGLTDKQFIWMAVAARAKMQMWKDIDVLLTTKGWLGSAIIKFVIHPEKFMELLFLYQASKEIIGRYVAMVENAEQRLNLAKKYGCHKVAVDTLKEMRDRQQLGAYASKIPRQTSEYIYAEDALKSSTVKWKN